MWSFQTIFHSCITASYKDEPISLYMVIQATKPSPHRGGKKPHDNNRFVFQRRGSGALQQAGNDKYLHAGPREGQATAALLSQTGIL